MWSSYARPRAPSGKSGHCTTPPLTYTHAHTHGTVLMVDPPASNSEGTGKSCHGPDVYKTSSLWRWPAPYFFKNSSHTWGGGAGRGSGRLSRLGGGADGGAAPCTTNAASVRSQQYAQHRRPAGGWLGGGVQPRLGGPSHLGCTQLLHPHCFLHRKENRN